MLVRSALASLLLLAPVPRALAAPAVRDTLVDVGGWRLRLDVHRGVAPVTIVLESGGGADASSWAAVPESLAVRTGATVVAYDRAGNGGSDLGPADLTPANEVRALHEALERLGVPPRQIIVGHSYGAVLAVLHASLFPDDVAGLVLVDGMNARFVRATGDFVHTTVPTITDPTTDRERMLVRLVRGFDDLVRSVEAVEPALTIPITVITAGDFWWRRGEEIDAAWRASHEAIASARENRQLIVAEGSRHDVPEARPDVIVDAVEALVREAGARP